MTRIYRIYYKFLKHDIMDAMQGEKTPDQIRRALENIQTDLRLALQDGDSIHVLEEHFDENYIVIAIETNLEEGELKLRMEKPLTLGLLFCDEHQK